MPLPLAVQHRPRRFSELVGQRHVAALLSRSLDAGRPPRQVLLTGSSGIGKTTVARVYAAALNCRSEQRAGGDACGACETCEQILAPGSQHPDVLELDAASYGGKDQIREIGQRAQLSPVASDWKIYVIDEAHGITAAGSQAFLKLLEDPPEHVVFVLATTAPGQLPDALRGRCVHLELLPPTAEEQRENLVRILGAEGWSLDEGALDVLVSGADGELGVRGAVTLLDKLSPLLASGEQVAAGDVAELLGLVDPEAVAGLVGMLEGGDRKGALVRVGALRRRHSDGEIRRAVIEAFRDRLVAVCAAGEDEALVLERYRTLVEAGQGAAHTDLAFARVAKPSLGTSSALLGELVSRAERVAGQLSGVAEVGPGSSAASSPPPPPSPEERWQQVLGELVEYDEDAAGLVARCVVDVETQPISVTVPGELQEEALDAQLPTLLEAASVDAAVPVRVLLG